MFDSILDKIKAPKDIEAAVAELIQATHDVVQRNAHDPATLQEFVAWLQEHQTEIALDIATETGEPLPGATAGETMPPPERKPRDRRKPAHQ